MALGQKIKGLAVEIDGETTGLEAAMKRVGKSANDINQELREVERGLKFDPGNTVLIAQKQELLRKKIGETETGLDALRQAQGEVEAMFKRGEIDDGQYRAFQREIATSESKLKTFEQQTKDAGQAQEKAGKATGDWSNKLKKLAAAAVSAAAIRQVVNAAKKLAEASIEAASDLNETVGKSEVVFGDSAEAINEWASTAAEALGQSRNQAQAAAATYGNLFVSMGIGQKKAADMSMAMVDLASDLASFNNASPEDVLEALRAGLVGETEPLKRFGVNLNDATLKQEALSLGLSDGKTTLDASTKAQAAYSLILKQTGTAQGDFARTSTGLANQQRILAATTDDLKARVGQALLPAYNAATAALIKMAPAIGDIVANLAEKMAPAFEWIATTVIPALTNMLTGEGEAGSLGTALSGVMQIMGLTKDLFVALWPVIQQAVQMFVDFFAGPSGQALIKGLLEAIGATLQILQQVFSEVWGAVQPIVQTFVDFLHSETGGRLITLFLEGVQGALSILRGVFEAAWPAMEAVLKVAAPVMKVVIGGIEAAVWLVVKAIEALQDAWWWISGQSYKSDLRDMRKNISDETKAMTQAYRDAVASGATNIVIGPGGQIITPQARGTIARRPQVALIGEAGDEVVAPVNDPIRSAELLYRSGLLAKIAGLAGGNMASSSTSTSIRIDRITIDGSRMSTPDFDGFLDSLQTALRMRPQTA